MTRFEAFNAKAAEDWDRYREYYNKVEIGPYIKCITDLEQLQNKLNYSLLVYLFGEQLGSHLAEKFVDSGRNILNFLGSLDSKYKFFLLHELKTNENLYVYC